MYYQNDTIAAIATPPGTGGVAMIRLSGPEAFGIAARLWQGRDIAKMPAGSAAYGRIAGSDAEVLDDVVLIKFCAPHSFTAEDTIEISCHGSTYIQHTLLTLLVDAGARIAEPGEFTRRAFLNGRIDLAQAEGIADLISASTAAAHRLAASQTRGDFSRALNTLRSRLTDLGALLELELDFSEEDVEFANRDRLLSLTREIMQHVTRLAQSWSAGRAIKEGLPVAIAGIPNAGKSTLLNTLAGDDRAIVSDIPGTTRDTVEDIINISGRAFRLIDTAGLRDTTDTVERLGIDRTRRAIGAASIILWLIDPTQNVDEQRTEMLKFTAENDAGTTIEIISKADCIPSTENNALSISAKTGEGIDILRSRLTAEADRLTRSEADVIVTNARHYQALRSATTSLQRMIEGLEAGVSADFIAQDLRETLHHLGAITGAITTDDLLHTIFSRFCIGK